MNELTSTSGDADIMSYTRIENNTFVLTHNGEDIKGSPLPGPPRFAEISGWCDGVRNFLASLEAQATADKRKARPLEPGLREVEEGDWKPEYTRVQPDPELDSLDIEEAGEYVASKVRTAKELMDKANKAFVKADKEYRDAHRKWLKWAQLAENFDGAAEGDDRDGHHPGVAELREGDSAGGTVQEDLHSGADEQRTSDELPSVLPGGGTAEQ